MLGGFRESRILHPYILRDSLVGLKRMIHTHKIVGSNPILATYYIYENNKRIYNRK